jgi:hypothetical protein
MGGVCRMITEIRVRIILNTKHEEEAIEAMKYNRNYKMVFSNTDITIFELIEKDRGRANNGK